MYITLSSIASGQDGYDFIEFRVERRGHSRGFYTDVCPSSAHEYMNSILEECTLLVSAEYILYVCSTGVFSGSGA